MLKKSDLDKSLCASPDVDNDMFFPDFDDPVEDILNKVHKAKDICNKCPIRMKCLQLALDQNENYGVWGGRDEWQIRRARFVDVAGKPIKDRPSIVCPNCLDESHKDLFVIENFEYTTDIGCHNCGLMWDVRRVINMEKPYWGPLT